MGVLLISLFAATNVSERVYAFGGGGTVTIKGKVSDANSNAISEASVKFQTDGATVSTTTDSNGDHELTDVSKGEEGTFTVSKEGYNSDESHIMFNSNDEKMLL